MLVTSADVASLDALLSWWEWVEYGAEAFVILGCVGEFIAEFTKIKTAEWRHQLSKASLLVLIAALAIELGALVRTNSLSGQEIGLLNGIAADARTSAANAELQVAGAKATAESAKATAKGFEAQIASAKERTAQLEKDAARLEKEAENERLARVKLEAEIEPRTLTLEQQRKLAFACQPFAGHEFEIYSYAGDAESARLAEQIENALVAAKIQVVNRIGSIMLWGTAPSQGVFVSEIEPDLSKVISASLSSAHIAFTVAPPKAGQKMGITIGVKPFKLLK